MNRQQGPSQNRRQPESKPISLSLSKDEKVFFAAIHERKSSGIWARDLKQEIKHLPDREVAKVLKSLVLKGLIKEVVNVRSKAKKPHYVATEFEPSAELTGGTWYADGNLDTELIAMLKQSCLAIVKRMKVATVEGVLESINSSKAFVDAMQKHQIDQILKSLVLDDSLMEVKSNETGDFTGIPFGKVCYKVVRKVARESEPTLGALASIPCGVCKNINLCTPDGSISPATCAYYTKWLNIDF